MNDNSFISDIIQIDKFSCLIKLLRVTALVIKFIAILRQKKEKIMVGSTKRLLFTSTVTFNELSTLLHETEVVINNRPLTYVYSELTDIPPLTRNYLIYGRNVNPIAKRVQHEELTNVNADIHLKYVTDLLNRFWKRWKNEYLTELREFHKRNISRNSELISEDDVVLITDEKQPRISWSVGRVLELIKGINDGVTRGEKVLCHTEQCRLSIIRRPVNKLVPLELNKIKNTDTMLKLTFIDETNIPEIHIR